MSDVPVIESGAFIGVWPYLLILLAIILAI